jgi:hypothetical protein
LLGIAREILVFKSHFSRSGRKISRLLVIHQRTVKVAVGVLRDKELKSLLLIMDREPIRLDDVAHFQKKTHYTIVHILSQTRSDFKT